MRGALEQVVRERRILLPMEGQRTTQGRSHDISERR